MKHRTVTVFIVVLASLAATPQALQQLTSLRDAAGERLNAGIWSAFLSVSGRKVEGAARTQTLPTVIESGRPAAFELASGGPRAAKAVPRAARSEERTFRAEHESLRPESFEFKLVGKELASLEGLSEVKTFEVGAGGRLLVRVPEAPAGVGQPLPPPPAYDMKMFKGRSFEYGVGEMLKGLEVNRVQEPQRRRQREHTRKAEAAQRVAEAVKAEAARSAGVEWKAEEPCPTRASVLNCETEVEELMN